jgi:acyl-CoA thioesterase
MHSASQKTRRQETALTASADAQTPGGHPFDAAVSLVLSSTSDESQPALSWQGQAHPGYQNMVGPFGGITAAQAIQGVLLHPARIGEPVTLTVNFAAALDPAIPFRLDATPVRTNRSTQHWTLRMVQVDGAGAEQVVLTGTAVTAIRRNTWSAVDAVMPQVPSPQTLPRVPVVNRMEWLRRYDFRLCAGSLPLQWDGAEADSLTQLWLRDDPPRPLDFASLTACADAFFPRVWRRRALMTPIGTVSMTVYFHSSDAELSATGMGYLLGQARAQSFFNGYFDQSAQLWNEAGHLLATTHQIVYFKE